jgi:hypothetical protein
MFPVRNLLFAILLPALCWCQPASELSARALFYREQPDQDKLPAVSKAKPAVSRKSQTVSKTSNQQKPGSASSGVPIIPVVQHLGLRYNVMLVNSQTGAAEPADPDRTFRRGECFALEFEANRSGYLYVLSQGSSGRWQSLFPSDEMPDESNIVRSRSSVRVPVNHCFQIEDPPGTERVFVVLSRNPEDLYDLHEAIRTGRGGSGEPSPTAPSVKPAPELLAMARVDREVQRLSDDLRSRDLRVVKVTRPEAAGEPPNSVYVVMASTAGARPGSSSAPPSDRVVTEIRIVHK